MVGEPNADNRLAIETRGHVTVLGTLPPLEPLTPAALQAAAETLDPTSELEPFLL